MKNRSDFIRRPLLQHPGPAGRIQPTSAAEPTHDASQPLPFEKMSDEDVNARRLAVADHFITLANAAAERQGITLSRHFQELASGSGLSVSYFRHVYDKHQFGVTRTTVRFLAAVYGVPAQSFFE